MFAVKILLLATGNLLAYKVLRCAAEIARDVYVLGDRVASRLGASRYCRAFRASSRPINRASADALVPEINCAIAELDIDMIIPGDFETSWLLATIAPRLQTRVFPLPAAGVLDQLNDKWSFNQLCLRLDIPAPASVLVADKAELAGQLAAAGPGRRHVVKPLAREGSNGFLDLARRPLAESLELIDYRPVLLQEYLAGVDICLSSFCQAGEVLATVVYTRGENSICFARHDEFERHAARIAQFFHYTGVLCFDGRLGPDGGVSFIECNPRFWNNMDVAMICGVNFVALGLPGDISRGAAIDSGVTLRNLAVSPRSIVRPWLFSTGDVRFLHYRLKDFSFIWEMRKSAATAA